MNAYSIPCLFAKRIYCSSLSRCIHPFHTSVADNICQQCDEALGIQEEGQPWPLLSRRSESHGVGEGKTSMRTGCRMSEQGFVVVEGSTGWATDQDAKSISEYSRQTFMGGKTDDSYVCSRK